ncbi:uncharacterized protein LOC124689360 [Lolium rigidum]|uniref:uncharacterized protein LOC124689360 n=1 Tax=Lolium rigidum TaxID=89674 RepID=UPI001F5DD94E|nr:uncharacterized protein LOC124689360 [Lolium rigidum]
MNFDDVWTCEQAEMLAPPSPIVTTEQRRRARELEQRLRMAEQDERMRLELSLILLVRRHSLASVVPLLLLQLDYFASSPPAVMSSAFYFASGGRASQRRLQGDVALSSPPLSFPVPAPPSRPVRLFPGHEELRLAFVSGGRTSSRGSRETQWRTTFDERGQQAKWKLQLIFSIRLSVVLVFAFQPRKAA